MTKKCAGSKKFLCDRLREDKERQKMYLQFDKSYDVIFPRPENGTEFFVPVFLFHLFFMSLDANLYSFS